MNVLPGPLSDLLTKASQPCKRMHHRTGWASWDYWWRSPGPQPSTSSLSPRMHTTQGWPHAIFPSLSLFPLPRSASPAMGAAACSKIKINLIAHNACTSCRLASKGVPRISYSQQYPWYRQSQKRPFTTLRPLQQSLSTPPSRAHPSSLLSRKLLKCYWPCRDW